MYDNGTTSFVIAIERLDTREQNIYPSKNSYGTVAKYTGKGEAMLWLVSPVTPAINDVPKRAEMLEIKYGITNAEDLNK